MMKKKLHIGKMVTGFLKLLLLQSSRSWQLSLVRRHLAAEMLNKQPLITFTVGRLPDFKMILSLSENKPRVSSAMRRYGQFLFIHHYPAQNTQS